MNKKQMRSENNRKEVRKCGRYNFFFLCLEYLFVLSIAVLVHVLFKDDSREILCDPSDIVIVKWSPHRSGRPTFVSHFIVTFLLCIVCIYLFHFHFLLYMHITYIVPSQEYLRVWTCKDSRFV